MTNSPDRPSAESDAYGEQLELPQLIREPPAEDVGALTHARYRFQWEVAARACMAMLTDDRIAAVLCEWHEDYVVIWRDASVQLASVKHRELSEGPWTLRELCLNGGVGHLYERWIALERRTTCVVSTNGGLRSGQGNASQFVAACHSRDEARIRPYADRISRFIGATQTDDVVEFCKRLSIEANIPGRSHISASNIQTLMVPALRTLGLDPGNAEPPYQAVVSAVEIASRDIGDRVTLRSLAEIGRLETDASLSAIVQSRLVTSAAVRASVIAALSSGTIPLVASTARAGVGRTRLVQKLERGGLGPTTIRAAQRLRAVWSEIEARYRSGLPG